MTNDYILYRPLLYGAFKLLLSVALFLVFCISYKKKKEPLFCLCAVWFALHIAKRLIGVLYIAFMDFIGQEYLPQYLRLVSDIVELLRVAGVGMFACIVLIFYLNSNKKQSSAD